MIAAVSTPGPSPFKQQDPAPVLRSVEVDGRLLSGVSTEPVSLPAQPGLTAFTYGSNQRMSGGPVRFRCQLDGYEREWHERTDLMRMVIRFIDADQRFIAEQVFGVKGQSPGWLGSLTDSPWIHRREVVVIPAGAVRFWVVVSSAGPPSAVGAYAIRNLQVVASENSTNKWGLIPPVRPDGSKPSVEATKLSPRRMATGRTSSG